jgi:hypothetical protein
LSEEEKTEQWLEAVTADHGWTHVDHTVVSHVSQVWLLD